MLKTTITHRKNEPTGYLGKLAHMKLQQTGKNTDRLKVYIIFLGIDLNYYYTALNCTPNIRKHCKEETNIFIFK